MTTTQKEIKIKTPYGEKNWSFVKRCFDSHNELLEACKDAQAILQDEFRLEPVDMGIMTQLSEAIARAERSES